MQPQRVKFTLGKYDISIRTVTCLIQIKFGAMVRSSYLTVVGACCENPKDTDETPQGPISRKSRKLLGPEKPFVKL